MVTSPFDIPDVFLLETYPDRQYQVFVTGISIPIRLVGKDCDFNVDLGTRGTLKWYRYNKTGCYKFIANVRSSKVEPAQ